MKTLLSEPDNPVSTRQWEFMNSYGQTPYYGQC